MSKELPSQKNSKGNVKKDRPQSRVSGRTSFMGSPSKSAGTIGRKSKRRPDSGGEVSKLEDVTNIQQLKYYIDNVFSLDVIQGGQTLNKKGDFNNQKEEEPRKIINLSIIYAARITSFEQTSKPFESLCRNADSRYKEIENKIANLEIKGKSLSKDPEGKKALDNINKSLEKKGFDLVEGNIQLSLYNYLKIKHDELLKNAFRSSCEQTSKFLSVKNVASFNVEEQSEVQFNSGFVGHSGKLYFKLLTGVKQSNIEVSLLAFRDRLEKQYFRKFLTESKMQENSLLFSQMSFVINRVGGLVADIGASSDVVNTARAQTVLHYVDRIIERYVDADAMKAHMSFLKDEKNKPKDLQEFIDNCLKQKAFLFGVRQQYISLHQRSEEDKKDLAPLIVMTIEQLIESNQRNGDRVRIHEISRDRNSSSSSMEHGEENIDSKGEKVESFHESVEFHLNSKIEEHLRKINALFGEYKQILDSYYDRFARDLNLLALLKKENLLTRQLETVEHNEKIYGQIVDLASGLKSFRASVESGSYLGGDKNQITGCLAEKSGLAIELFNSVVAEDGTDNTDTRRDAISVLSRYATKYEHEKNEIKKRLNNLRKNIDVFKNFKNDLVAIELEGNWSNINFRGSVKPAGRPARPLRNLNKGKEEEQSKFENVRSFDESNSGEKLALESGQDHSYVNGSGSSSSSSFVSESSRFYSELPEPLSSKGDRASVSLPNLTSGGLADRSTTSPFAEESSLEKEVRPSSNDKTKKHNSSKTSKQKEKQEFALGSIPLGEAGSPQKKESIEEKLDRKNKELKQIKDEIRELNLSKERSSKENKEKNNKLWKKKERLEGSIDKLEEKIEAKEKKREEKKGRIRDKSKSEGSIKRREGKVENGDRKKKGSVVLREGKKSKIVTNGYIKTSDDLSLQDDPVLSIGVSKNPSLTTNVDPSFGSSSDSQSRIAQNGPVLNSRNAAPRPQSPMPSSSSTRPSTPPPPFPRDVVRADGSSVNSERKKAVKGQNRPSSPPPVAPLPPFGDVQPVSTNIASSEENVGNSSAGKLSLYPLPNVRPQFGSGQSSGSNSSNAPLPAPLSSTQNGEAPVPVARDTPNSASSSSSPSASSSIPASIVSPAVGQNGRGIPSVRPVPPPRKSRVTNPSAPSSPSSIPAPIANPDGGQNSRRIPPAKSEGEVFFTAPSSSLSHATADQMGETFLRPVSVEGEKATDGRSRSPSSRRSPSPNRVVVGSSSSKGHSNIIPVKGKEAFDGLGESSNAVKGSFPSPASFKFITSYICS